jgi:adenosine kinase
MGLVKLIVCGSIAIDRIMHFSGKFAEVIDPDKLDTLSVSVLVEHATEAWGGGGANIAYAAAQLGIEQPVLFGSAGPDAAAYLDGLAQAGVDTAHVHISELPSASFSVLTDSVSNQFGGFYPGAMADSSSLSFAGWQPEQILVCITAHDPAAMRAQAAECKAQGIRLLYDPGQQVTNLSGADLRAGIEAAELVMVNEYEHAMLLKKTGLSADELTAKVPVVVVTRGADGSIISGSRLPQALEIPAAPPSRVADPSGAGDSYRAGFLYGYLRQWELETCGKLAATVASFLVEQHGSQCQLSAAAITKRYQEAFNEEISLHE